MRRTVNGNPDDVRSLLALALAEPDAWVRFEAPGVLFMGRAADLHDSRLQAWNQLTRSFEGVAQGFERLGRAFDRTAVEALERAFGC